MIGRIYLFIMFIYSSSLFALDSDRTVVPNDKVYFKKRLQNSNVELIYTKENLAFAKDTAQIEKPLHTDYENFYHWSLDETLYVGLISDKNEIANGFSSQWPNNRQINYIGGTSEVDYFSNTSWLHILLYHETAHNYQVNVKASLVSRVLHTIFANGTFFIPTYFTVPGSAANSFMLEGNAVLNESWHGDGGRLYSGRLEAMTTLQAKAGNIRAEYMYNARLKFPYTGAVYYQIGALYNLYLAQKYGLKKVNSYFLNKTQEWWWPFFTNSAMYKSIGITFENSLNNFARKYKKRAENFILAKGDFIRSSQFYTELSSDKNEIFFLTNETGYRVPELVVINKKSEKIHTTRGSWIAGKIIKSKNRYYTQASNHISVTEIKQGLYDKNAFIKKGSESKVVQAYLSDGKALYFDVASSYDTPQLYLGKQFYAKTNSSVIIDKDDNIYYFANKKGSKERTLYKNKEALFTYKGFYGIVCDVDNEGSVYFIANSKLGTTLYRYKNSRVTRASSADNIVQARLFNDKEVLLHAIGEKEYYYVKSTLETIEKKPYETKLFFEKMDYYTSYKDKNSTVSFDRDEKYRALLNMHYSGTNISFSALNDGSITGSLNLNFSDPLTQNSLDLLLLRDESKSSVLGISYTNSKNILEYMISAYAIVEKSPFVQSRDNALVASLTLALYKAGYYNSSLTLTYFQDYDTLSREPLTASFSLSDTESFGISMYKNYENSIELYGVKERTDNIYGASYMFKHELGGEFYMKSSLKYSYSDADISQVRANQETRGVKISPLVFQQNMDLSTVIMPSIENYVYIKSIGYGELGISKVFNLSAYFFTFPFSLQREALYFNYRYYRVNTFNKSLRNERVNEYNVGLKIDTVFLNILSPFSFSFDYYYNDNSNFSKDTEKFLFNFGATF